MTKKDLMTGDVIVNRMGYLGVVLKEEEKFLYQLIGSDYLWSFNDDLTFVDTDYRDGDIMQVYRETDFLEVENEDTTPIYQRDFTWYRPTDEERDAFYREREAERQSEIESMRNEENKVMKNYISIITQCFYGNRVATEIKRENVKFFLAGILSPELFPGEYETVDVKTVNVPGTQNIVIVYDQNQENNRIDDEETEYITCEIPEIGLKLHTRCLNSATPRSSLSISKRNMIFTYISFNFL